jgi:hypothetical protein
MRKHWLTISYVCSSKLVTAVFSRIMKVFLKLDVIVTEKQRVYSKI